MSKQGVKLSPAAMIDRLGILQQEIAPLVVEADELKEALKHHALKKQVAVVCGKLFGAMFSWRKNPDTVDREALYRVYGREKLIQQGIVSSKGQSLVLKVTGLVPSHPQAEPKLLDQPSVGDAAMTLVQALQASLKQ